MIEAVKQSKTIMDIQRLTSSIGALTLGNWTLNRWLKEHCKSPEDYEASVDRFTRSCAGYSVATFVLGIKDRHQDNIMVTEDGRVSRFSLSTFLHTVFMTSTVVDIPH